MRGHGKLIEISRVARQHLGPGVDAVGNVGRWLHHDEFAQVREFWSDGQDARKEGLILDDRDRRAAVTGQILNLLLGGGVVDGDRRRPEEHHRDVRDMELRTIPHHQHDSVTPRDAQSGQAAGESTGLVGIFGVGHLVPAVADFHAERDLIRQCAHGVTKQRRHGLPGRRGVDLSVGPLRHSVPRFPW